MTENEIKDFICSKFLGGDHNFPIDRNTKLLENGICDSLGMVQIASEVERRNSGLIVPDQDVTRENFGSIGAIIDYLHSKLA